MSADVTHAPKCSKLDTNTDSTPHADDENSVSASLPDKLSSFAVRTTSKKAFFTASLRPSLPPITESNTDNQGNTNPVVRQEETTTAGLIMNKTHHIAGNSHVKLFHGKLVGSMTKFMLRYFLTHTWLAEQRIQS